MVKTDPILKICLLGEDTYLNGNIGQIIAGRGTKPLWIKTCTLVAQNRDIIEQKRVTVLIPSVCRENISNDKALHKLIQGSSGGLIVMNSKDRKSYEAIPSWVRKFREIEPNLSLPLGLLSSDGSAQEATARAIQKLKDGYPVFSFDLKRFKSTKKKVVTPSETKRLANALNLIYFDVGFLDCPKITSAFDQIAQMVFDINQGILSFT